MSATAPPQSPPQEDVEALIEEAWQHARRRQRRRRVAVLAGAGLVALVALVWAAVSDGGAARHGSAGRAGGAAGGRLPQYRYTRAAILAAAGSGLPRRSVTVENWVGTDGSWRLRETVLGGGPGSLDVVTTGDGLLPPQTNTYGAFDGVPFNPHDPGDGLFTDKQLASLPTDPSALATRLTQAVAAEDLRNLNAYLGPGPHTPTQLRRLRHVFLGRRVSQTLLAIADLDMTPLPDPLTYALYRVARELPGAHVTVAGPGPQRREVRITADGYSMTFDDHTGMLRSGSTGVFFDQGSAGTIKAQGIVSSLDAIPKGVAPVPSRVERPPTIAITPRTGTPTTTFTLRTRLNHPATTSTVPALAAEMFGPTGPNCTFWASRPPIARIPPGTVTRSGTGAVAAYQITPNVIGRRTWCPGRYQLMINPATTVPGHSSVPRSFAATYFEIH